jgi:hypothetical protein
MILFVRKFWSLGVQIDEIYVENDKTQTAGNSDRATNRSRWLPIWQPGDRTKEGNGGWARSG